MSPQAEALIALLQRRVVWQATGAVMVSWFFGYYGFGFWWGLWLVPLFYTWERIHSRRFVRQQVQKYADLVQERDEPEIESVEWINRMMRIAWPTMGPYISDIIMDKSAEALDANKPMMVSRMCLEGVTMGLAPPVINDVIVYKSDANVLDIECTINFDSQIAMEMAAYTKPARVPILVKEPQFNARSRVTAWLIPREPFLSQMRVSFLERPDIDVTVKPISVGPDVINLVPGLSGAIKDMFIGMFSDQWIHPKFLEIVLEQPEGDEPLKVTVEEKQHKKGVIAGGVGAVGALGASGAGLVGSGVGMVGSGAAGATKAVGAGVGKVGAVGANTTKAVGGAAVGGAKAVGGAAAAGIGSVGKLGSSGVSAFSGGVNKVNPFAKKKSSDADGAKKDKKDKKESSSSGFGFGFGKKKEKKKTAADSESARELSATEEASEEAAAAAPERERSKKSLLGFGRTKSSKKVADDESTKEPSAAEEASEGSEKRRHKKHKGDSERKHKKHRKHREHGDEEDASEASEASEGGDEDRTERSERKRKTRRKKDGEEKKHKHTHKHHHDEEKEEEKEPSEDALHHLADSVSDGLSALNPFGKKKKKEKATKD